MSRSPESVWGGRRVWGLVAMAGLLTGGSLVAVAQSDGDGDDPAEETVLARGLIRSCGDRAKLHGNVFLRERISSEGVKVVDVFVHARGLTPGPHAVHVHEVGSCEPCEAAGGHFDPGPAGNPEPDANHPFHAGDLVNLHTGENGAGKLKTLTTRFTLSAGPLSIFDEDGAAVIIHGTGDTFCPNGPEPGCAGQERVACAILERME